jgi:hypothetical protein
MEKNKICFALYDSRYLTNEEDASCYVVEDTLKEAKKSKREDYIDAVIVKETLELVEGNTYNVIKSEIVS